jgi:hypothetical protein
VAIQERRAADTTARLDILLRELEAMNLHFNDVSPRTAGADEMASTDLIDPYAKPPVDARQALEGHRAQLRNEYEGTSAKVAAAAGTRERGS